MKQVGQVVYGIFVAVQIMGGLILAVLVPHPVQADDAALGTVGYVVMPLDNEQVQMVSERVEADLSAWSAQVTCVFTFTNPGTATTVLMGFPETRGRPGRGDDTSLKDFRAFVDGQEVAVTFCPQAEPQDFPEYAGWHAFSVSFGPGQTRTMRNIYRGGLTYISDGGFAFQYVLQSGATWASVIREANITVRWSRQRDVAPNTISAYGCMFLNRQVPICPCQVRVRLDAASFPNLRTYCALESAEG